MNKEKQLQNYQKKTQKTSTLNQPVSSGSLSETDTDIPLTTKRKNKKRTSMLTQKENEQGKTTTNKKRKTSTLNQEKENEVLTNSNKNNSTLTQENEIQQNENTTTATSKITQPTLDDIRQSVTRVQNSLVSNIVENVPPTPHHMLCQNDTIPLVRVYTGNVNMHHPAMVTQGGRYTRDTPLLERNTNLPASSPLRTYQVL